MPFWTSRWGGFGDIQRPNSELAARLDVRLNEAVQRGDAPRPLVILDGATFERQGVFNWEHHPLRNVLLSSGEVFRDPRGIDFCRRWMRYACARWGMSKAVNSLLLSVTLPTPGASTFHARIATELQQFAAICQLPVRTLHPFACEPQTIELLNSFEQDPATAALNNWYADPRISQAIGHRVVTASTHGQSAFEITAISPATTTLALTSVWMLGAPETLSQADALLFDVWVSSNAPHDLRLGVHLCDQQDHWYEALLPGMARPGEWTTFALDLSSQNLHQLQPVKHDLAWNAPHRQRIHELGLHVYSTHPNWTPAGLPPQSLSARFDHVRAVRFARAGEQNNPLPRSKPTSQTLHTVAELGTFETRSGRQKSSAWVWSVDQRICRGVGSVVSAEQPSHPSRVYEVRSQNASDTFVGLIGNCAATPADYRELPDDLSAADALTFEVFLPADMPPDLRIGVHLRDRNGEWFQTLLPGCPRPNEWCTFALDLTGKNTHRLRPGRFSELDSAAPVWSDYSRHRISQIGLYLFSTHPDWIPPDRDEFGHENEQHQSQRSGRTVALHGQFDQIRAVRFENDEPPRAITLYTLPLPLLDAAGSSAEVYSQGAAAEYYHIGDLWQSHFKINKIFSNPYDPRICDLSALITTPSGKKVCVPAFFNQICRRREALPGGDEIVEPLGEEFFSVRYRILEAGEYRVKLELREGGKYEIFAAHPPSQGDTVHWIPGQLTATEKIGNPTFTAEKEPHPSAVSGPVSVASADEKRFKGFVRASDNKRNLEWDDGSFFYPIGPCLCSPSDNRIPYADPKWNADFLNVLARRGTYQYDEFFSAYQKAGINWARVWMCSWWVSLEWRRDWPGYQGIGRYNLPNAWRLDYLLDQAEKKEITLMLCLTNHGQYSLKVDQEWQNNPYSTLLGGPLAQARDFFRQSEAKIWHQNKLRYILARYGHSPAIMAWSLFTEVEWTQEYEPSLKWNGIDTPAPNIESWHVEMARFLKENDPNHHLVSTHFSYPTHGERTLLQPEIEIASSNAYSAFDYFKIQDKVYDAAQTLSEFWAGNTRGVSGFHIFNKPALVEEQGRHWMGVENGKEHNTRAQLDADLHAGLWGSMVQPLCGATGYWWWLHLHFDQRYQHYRAFANFMKNEDFRASAKDGETTLEPVYRALKTQGSPAQEVLGRAMKSNRRLYGWIYHAQMPLGGVTPDVEGAKLKVSGLKAGFYSVEFWDTYKGTITESREVEIKDGVSLELTLPAIKADLALKIKPRPVK